MPWDYIAILAVLAVIVPWRSTARVQAMLRSPVPPPRIGLYLSTMVFQWGISAILLWRTQAHGLRFAQLGLAVPNEKRAIIAAASLSAALVLNQIFGVKRLRSLPAERRGLIPQLAEKLLPRNRREVVIAVALVITVAICEEFIYRGFIESVFEQAFASVFAGAVISAAFFAVAHMYQGRRGLVTTFVVGLLFSAARIWSGSLLPPIVMHFAADFTAGAAASRMLLEPPAAAGSLEAAGRGEK